MTRSELPGDPHIWVVLTQDKEPAFASLFPAFSRAYINDMIDKRVEGADQWVVREYMRVLSRPEIDALAGEGVDTQQLINSLMRTIDGQRKHIASMQRRIEETRGDD